MSDFHDHHGDPRYAQDRGYEWDSPPQAAPRRRRGLFSLGIVVAAVGAFCLLIWFVYTQGRRAGTEVVAPVIHADPGPTKVKPEAPGGMDVPNQDRLIYERLRADKDGGDGVEHLLPPPETPMARPQAAPVPAAAAPPAPAPSTVADAPSGTAVLGAAVSGTAAVADTAAVAPPPAPIAAPIAAPATPVPTPPKAPVAKVEPPRPTPIPSPAPAPTPSPTASPMATVTAPAVPAKSGGAVMKVQFASVPSDAQAVAEVQRIQRKHAAVLGGVALTVVRADLGAKGVYFRVQAGPMDEAQARRLCDAVKAGGDNCIPVH